MGYSWNEVGTRLERGWNNDSEVILMGNVKRINTSRSVQRILEKIAAGQALNEIEKNILRWSAVRNRRSAPQEPSRNTEPAA